MVQQCLKEHACVGDLKTLYVQASAYQLIDLLFEAEGRSDLEQCLIGRTAGSIGASSFFQEASDQYASIIKQETGATKARVDLVLISQDLAWPAGMQADDRHQLPPTCSGVLPQSVPTLILKLCFRELRCPARTGHTQCPWADFGKAAKSCSQDGPSCLGGVVLSCQGRI